MEKKERLLLFLLNIVALALHVLLVDCAGALENDRPPYHFSPSRRTQYIRVQRLTDSGPGSLRACVSAKGSRVCLFEVGGIVRLRSPLVVTNPEIFIAGQTAPSPGITITGAGISIRTQRVEIHHVAIRPGDSGRAVAPTDNNALSVGVEPPGRARFVSLRHLSLTWAIDENFSTWYATTSDVSLSNSIIAEGLHDSLHPEGPHSSGILIGQATRRVALTGNLIAFNHDRNPRIQAGSSVSFTNNMVYGWGGSGPWNICNISSTEDDPRPIIASVVGNLWVPAPYSFIAQNPLYIRHVAEQSEIYTYDNFGPTKWGGQTGIALDSDSPVPARFTTSCPFRLGCRGLVSARSLEDTVLANVGSRPKDRASIDDRIIDDVRHRVGTIKDCLIGCMRPTGGLPPMRQTRRRLVLPRHPRGDRNHNGISHVAEWIARYSAAVAYQE